MEKESDRLWRSRGLPSTSGSTSGTNPSFANWLKQYREEFDACNDPTDLPNSDGSQQQPHQAQEQGFWIQLQKKHPKFLQRAQKSRHTLQMVLSPRRAFWTLRGISYSTLALICFTAIICVSPSEGAPIPTPANAYNRPTWLGQLPFQFAAPVFQVVPWIVNAFQTEYRNMELVANMAEMQLANLTDPSMENHQRRKRFVSPIFWDLIQTQCKPQEQLKAPFIRDRTLKDSQEHHRQKRFVAPFVLGFIWSRLALQKGNRTAFVPEKIRPQDFSPESPENLRPVDSQDHPRQKRQVFPFIWGLSQSVLDRNRPFIPDATVQSYLDQLRQPVVPENLHPRERREIRNVSQEMAAQINRTAWIIQELLNPGLPIRQLLHQVETDRNVTSENSTFTSAQDYILATRRSQNLSTFAMFSLIMAFIMAAILVAGICAQLGLKAEEDLEKTSLPIIKMTSIIDPEDIISDVLPLVRTDPHGNGIVGETP